MKFIDLIQFFIFYENNIVEYKNDNNIINHHLNFDLHFITNVNKRIRDQFIVLISDFNSTALYFHIFKKKYDINTNKWNIDELLYINSFILNESNSYNNKFNWILNKNDEVSISDNDYNEEVNNSLFINPIGLSITEFLLSRYINIDLLHSNYLTKIKVYYNFANSNIMLSMMIFTIFTSNYGFKTSNINTKIFEKYNKNNLYIDLNMYHDYKNFLNIIDYTIVCDYCNQNIENDIIWHNNNQGDMCNECYNIQYKKERDKYNAIIKQILLIGKKVIFQKELLKTRKFLKDYDFNYDKSFYLKQIVHNYVNMEKKYTCGICLNTCYFNDISVGRCGHWFHTNCINRVSSSEIKKCPVCRIRCEFIKIYT